MMREQEERDVQFVVGTSDSSDSELLGWRCVTTDSDEVQPPSDNGIALGTNQEDASVDVGFQMHEYIDDVLQLERIAEAVVAQVEVVIDDLRPLSDSEGNGSMSSGGIRDGGAREFIIAAVQAVDLEAQNLDDGTTMEGDGLGMVDDGRRIQASVTESTDGGNLSPDTGRK